MKASKYNLFFEHNDIMLGYNSLYETGVCITKASYHIAMNGLLSDVSIQHLSINHPKIYQILLKEKFIIEDNIDEIELARTILHQTNCDNSTFNVIINPTVNCNFNCWYCYESHVSGSKMSAETVAKTIAFIKLKIDTIAELKNLQIGWFGGEPLLYYKDVVEPILSTIVPYAKEHGIEVYSSFTTNGYLINKSFLSSSKRLHFSNLQITLDGNKEIHNRVRFTHGGRGSYDRIVSNILQCIKFGLNVTVRLNISADTNINVPLLLESFKSLDTEERKLLRFSIHKVWQEKDERVIEDVENLAFQIRSLGFQALYYPNYPTTLRQTCYADKTNQVTINYNGDVFKCTARDFSTRSREGVLKDDGTVYWENQYFARNAKSVFDYQPCNACKIMPICNAGCSQLKIENEQHVCPYKYEEGRKVAYAKKVLLENLYLRKLETK
jgi:uncharacterized protein